VAAGLVVPNSGPYTGTWQAFPFGTLSDDGYEIACTIQGQEVNETDAFGMTLVEAIYRGQNWRVRLRGLEWKTGLLTALQMFGTSAVGGTTPPIPAAANLIPVLANVGDRWTKYCQPLVLTAILGNPPTTPQSLTAVNAGIAPQQQSMFNATSKVKELPLEFVLLPYSATVGSLTVSVPFTTT
jgi:hypothetical protein